MGDTLEYTAEEAQQEESIFKTPAAIARRRLVREQLDFQLNENVPSIGCGPGFEPVEIADVIGPNGHVSAIDQNEAMLTLAERRCSDTSNITRTRAEAVALPFDFPLRNLCYRTSLRTSGKVSVCRLTSSMWLCESSVRAETGDSIIRPKTSLSGW
ncbi:methyltransferase domain-containing protein [Halalkalicoccus ordinarius]|uniref:methyltransferase domain-containing protein n=1 Tax=Halalkalicoccus ordinarius TaxID=3116651 RepID=UPI00390833CA